MQVSTILRDFASYYTFSLAVANDAENAQMKSLRKRSRPEMSIKSDTVMLQVV